MQVEDVKHILMTEDMDRAIAFWVAVFNAKPRSISPHWSELDLSGATIALHGGGDSKRRRSGLSIQVSNLEAAVGRVPDAGGRALEAPVDRPGEPLRLALLADTEGNEFMVTERTEA